MKKVFAKSFIVLTVAVISAISVDIYAQRTRSSLSAGQQVNAEKGLKDNRYFFFYINPTVTNMGAEPDREKFREAVQRDFIAQLLYMRFMFHDSFVEIRRAQKLLIDVYTSSIKKNVSETKKLLNGVAPLVVRSGNSAARHYLRLGYRELSSGRVDMIMADNYRETLYSMRLLKYVWAMKKSLQGKRFAFLALLETTYPRRDLSRFDIMSYEELHEMMKERAAVMAGPVPEKERKTAISKMYRIEQLQGRKAMLLRRRRKDEAEEVSREIETLIKEKKDLDNRFASAYPEYGSKRKYYLLHFEDSYYKTGDKKTIFDQVWEDPRLEEISEFKEYLKKQ